MTKSKYRLPLLWGIFALYSALTLLGALNHEVWLDEAQAWVILRDAPLSELPRILKVEGHPPLWYLILYPFVKLGFPVDHVSLISWFFMAAGALVLLFKVELPLPLKAVILASGGFLYFNSVMLRVYCLIPLLLFLILWIYPKRREHAVLYGVLVALLANTHVFICGIVGILGIYMLYELFSEWKSSAKKENIKKLAGLAAAGAGVLILVLPLLGSIGANGVASDNMSAVTANVVAARISGTLYDVFMYNILPPNKESLLWQILFVFFSIGFWVMLIELRHWRRAFAAELVFLGVYYITCGLVWITRTNRAVIFVLSFAFALCLAEHEKPVFGEYKISELVGGKIRALLEGLIKADKNSKKIITVITAVFLALSIPSGIKYLFTDIFNDFSGAKQTAEYISNNFEKDAVFVQIGEGMPELTFYDPEIKVFSVSANEITTYAKWEYRYRPKESAETVLESLSEYENLYLIYYPTSGSEPRRLFISEGENGYDYHLVTAIGEFDKEFIENYFIWLEETHEQAEDN